MAGLGETTTTQTTTIPGAGSQELGIRRLLEQLAQGGVSQLGDLGPLARGEVGRPTGAEQELIAASIQRASQLAQEQMRQAGTIQGAQLREQLTGRGVAGSSADVAQNLLQSLGTQGGITQSILQAQQAGGEALLNLPFMRGQQQLQANQALFQRILSSAAPVLQAGLQERIAQPTTTQVQQQDPLAQLVQFGNLATSFSLPNLLSPGQDSTGESSGAQPGFLTFAKLLGGV